MTFNVTLRSKTLNVLTNQKARQTLRDVINNHMATGDWEMQELIWKLKNKPEKTSKELGFEGLTKSEVNAVREELVHFYKAIHPSWEYIGTQLDQETRQTLWKVIGENINADTKAVNNLLWKLSYQPKEASEAMGFNKLTKGQVREVQDTIARFYRAAHPEWKYGQAFTHTTNAEKALLKALGGDPYVYDRLMFRLRDRAGWQGANKEKLEACLNSHQEKSWFGGIRQLSFNREEAIFLKGAIEQIRAVYKEQCERFNKKLEKRKQEREQLVQQI